MKAPVEFAKDNVANAAVMMATVIAFAGAAFGPHEDAALQVQEVVQLEPVVVTAQRMPLVDMDKIVIVAARAD